jgi:hypothetical protein
MNSLCMRILVPRLANLGSARVSCAQARTRGRLVRHAVRPSGPWLPRRRRARARDGLVTVSAATSALVSASPNRDHLRMKGVNLMGKRKPGGLAALGATTVWAFQEVQRLTVDGVVGTATKNPLVHPRAYPTRYTHVATRVEVNLPVQRLRDPRRHFRASQPGIARLRPDTDGHRPVVLQGPAYRRERLGHPDLNLQVRWWQHAAGVRFRPSRRRRG